MVTNVSTVETSSEETSLTNRPSENETGVDEESMLEMEGSTDQIRVTGWSREFNVEEEPGEKILSKVSQRRAKSKKKQGNKLRSKLNFVKNMLLTTFTEPNTITYIDKETGEVVKSTRKTKEK